MAASVIAGAQQFASDSGVATSTTALKGVYVEQRVGTQLPLGAKFLDRDGNPVTLDEVGSRRPLIVLPLFYRCQGVCNVEFQNLLSALEKNRSMRVGSDFDVVILGIDPTEGPNLANGKFQDAQREFPSLMVGKGWHFLTGTLANIHSITDALGFYYTYDAQKDLINHPSGLMFVSPGGTISSYILSPSFTPSDLQQDLLFAKKSEVGPKVKDVFFGCIHIDPLTGKRSLVFEKVLRVAGYAFLVIAVAGITLLSRNVKTPNAA
jgi:protein SCO1/2